MLIKKMVEGEQETDIATDDRQARLIPYGVLIMRGMGHPVIYFERR